MWEYLLRFFWWKPPEIREINLNPKVTGVIGDGGIYLKGAQGITGIPKQPNLEKDRQQ